MVGCSCSPSCPSPSGGAPFFPLAGTAGLGCVGVRISADGSSGAMLGHGDGLSAWDKTEEWEATTTMSFCEHCEGQRFDRAQVLRVLRATRKRLRTVDDVRGADGALGLAIRAVHALEIPHLERLDEMADDSVVH